MDQWGVEELKRCQREDPVLELLHRWKDADTLPSADTVALEDPAKRFYWLCWERVQRKEGVLYYEWSEEVGVPPRMLLMVPHSMQQDILHVCHCPPQSGHLGRDKTLSRV